MITAHEICCTRETHNLSASINERTASACIRQWSLIQTENDHRCTAAILSAKSKQTWARNNRETILERQRVSRRKNKRRKENAQKSQQTVSPTINTYTQYTRHQACGPTSLAHRENVFHFSCSLFIVIVFRIYMFDFIIIRVTSEKENKGAFLFRYEIIGLHAFHPSGWRILADGIWYAVLFLRCVCVESSLVCWEKRKQNGMRDWVRALVCMAEN